MNSYEIKMVKILTDLVDNNGVIGIKTSFEDEGATFNEVIRLKEICNQANIKLNLKIGGPEAIRDIKDSIIIGVKGLVAPMVESSFGLKKFIGAVEKHVDPSIIPTLNLAMNVETKTTIDNLDEMLEIDDLKKLYAITIGRVDLSSSLGLERNQINNEQMLKIIKDAYKKIKSKRMKTNMGGGISVEAFEFIQDLYSDGLLDNVETRYVMFDVPKLLKNYKDALHKAQEFEYTWLTNKKILNTAMAEVDDQRIQMIEERIRKSQG